MAPSLSDPACCVLFPLGPLKDCSPLVAPIIRSVQTPSFPNLFNAPRSPSLFLPKSERCTFANTLFRAPSL